MWFGVRERMDSRLFKQAQRLRSRARWYRMFAKLGDSARRPDREALAEKFDQMAQKAEEQASER
jgi:hypothetical protein